MRERHKVGTFKKEGILLRAWVGPAGDEVSAEENGGRKEVGY